MSQTNSYGYSNSGIFFLRLVQDGYGYHGPVAAFTATGTDATLRIIYAPTVTVFVDGVQSTIATNNTSDFVTYPLFSGLTDGPHAVVIYFSGLYGADPSAFITLTGAAPSLAKPAWAGATAAVLGSDSYLLTEGNPRLFTYDSIRMTLGSNQSLRFRQKCSSITVSGTNSGAHDQSFMVVVDGVEHGPISDAFPDSGPLGVQTLVTGLDPAVTHDVAIIEVGVNTRTYVADVILGGLAAWDTTPIAPRKFVAFFGDSITEDWIVTPATAGFVYKVGRLLNVATAQLGIGGSAVEASGPGVPQVSTAAVNRTDLTGLPKQPDAIVFLYGRNDQASTYTPLKAAYLQMLQQTRAGWASAPFVSLGVLGNTASDTDPLWSAVHDAVAQFADAHTHYYNTDGWINPTQDTGDGIHPTAAGYTKVAAQLAPRLVPVLAQPGYALSVTATGLTATATATIATGATWTGDQSITLAWGDGNTSSVTPTAGQTAATATHTYGTAGTKSVVGTNGQAWVDPAPQSVAVTAGGSTPTPTPTYTPVTGLTLSGQTVAGTLSWTAAAGAAGYDVTRNGTTVSGNQAGTSFAVTGAVAGDVYAVVARYGGGNAQPTTATVGGATRVNNGSGTFAN